MVQVMIVLAVIRVTAVSIVVVVPAANTNGSNRVAVMKVV